jgi:hypothetical protein
VETPVHTLMNGSRDRIIGVYDRSEDIASSLRQYVAEEQLLLYFRSTAAALSRCNFLDEYLCDEPLPLQSNSSIEQTNINLLLHGKHEFFSSVSCAILLIDALEDLHIFAHALMRLIARELRVLWIVSDLDLLPLLQLGTQEEVAAIEELLAQSKLVFGRSFSVEAFLARCD